jgi:hypothetical protein
MKFYTFTCIVWQRHNVASELLLLISTEFILVTADCATSLICSCSLCKCKTPLWTCDITLAVLIIKLDNIVAMKKSLMEVFNEWPCLYLLFAGLCKTCKCKCKLLQSRFTTCLSQRIRSIRWDNCRKSECVDDACKFAEFFPIYSTFALWQPASNFSY